MDDSYGMASKPIGNKLETTRRMAPSSAQGWKSNSSTARFDLHRLFLPRRRYFRQPFAAHYLHLQYIWPFLQLATCLSQPFSYVITLQLPLLSYYRLYWCQMPPKLTYSISSMAIFFKVFEIFKPFFQRFLMFHFFSKWINIMCSHLFVNIIPEVNYFIKQFMDGFSQSRN